MVTKARLSRDDRVPFSVALHQCGCNFAPRSLAFRSCDRNCSIAKIYADLKTAKEVQTEQTVDLGRWRKSVREDGEIVDGFT
jgi:hypothetical protein